MPRRTPRDPINARWTTIDGLRLRALVATNPGPATLPVVLVPGFGLSARYLVPTAQRLAPRGPVYMPELPGFGRSDCPALALDLPTLADFLVRWLAANQLGPVAMLGNSFGCQIIADVAMRYPACVTRIILVGPTVDRHARTAHQQIWHLLRDARREAPLEPLLATRDYLRFGVLRSWRTLQVALADRIEEKLPLIQAPALVIRGGRDPLVSQRWAEEVAHRLPAGRLLVLPGVAHAPNFSAPATLLRAITPFLSET